MPLNVLLLFCQVVIHTIRLPKQSTVGDVINDLKTKVILQFFAFQNWMSDSIIVGTVILKITITCIPRPSENIYFLTVLSPLLLFTKFACIVKRIKKKKITIVVSLNRWNCLTPMQNSDCLKFSITRSIRYSILFQLIFCFLNRNF